MNCARSCFNWKICSRGGVGQIASRLERREVSAVERCAIDKLTTMLGTVLLFGGVAQFLLIFIVLPLPSVGFVFSSFVSSSGRGRAMDTQRGICHWICKSDQYHTVHPTIQSTAEWSMRSIVFLNVQVIVDKGRIIIDLITKSTDTPIPPQTKVPSKTL